MKPLRAYLLLGGLLCIALACAEPGPREFPGYCEAEFVYVAPAISGRLETLAVSDGQSVSAGDRLFELDAEYESQALAAAKAKVAQARDQLADLSKGRRPSRIEAIEAELRQAKSALALSRKQYSRRKQLHADGIASNELLDQARTAYQRDQANVARIEAELATARLAAREDRIQAARAAVQEAEAKRKQAQWRLEQKQGIAPADARVFDTLFDPGEWVMAARPVVSLLAPENLHIRFFVPEPILGKLSVGQPVIAKLDGRTEPVEATISYISPRAEYTPPVIYSDKVRAKLVFQVEAVPVAGTKGLHPGQPAQVRLLGETS